jgi:hypothetical protein
MGTFAGPLPYATSSATSPLAVELFHISKSQFVSIFTNVVVSYEVAGGLIPLIDPDGK